MIRITITVGVGEDAEGHKVSHDEVKRALSRIRGHIAAETGGYTETPSYGGWLHDGQLIEEPGRRFTTLTDKPELADSLARYVGRELHQRAVSLEVETVDSRLVNTQENVA